MTQQEATSFDPTLFDGYSARPELTIVSNEEVEVDSDLDTLAVGERLVPWRSNISDYRERRLEKDLNLVLLEQLAARKNENPSIWEPVYGNYDEARAVEALSMVIEVFGDHVSEDEIVDTLGFVESAFADYYDEHPSSVGASYAFVVPTRISQGVDFLARHMETGEAMPEEVLDDANNRYASEIVQFLPLTRHLDPTTRQQLFAMMPPFIFESYAPTEDTERGIVVFSPVFPDMLMGGENFGNSKRIARDIVNDTVGFVNRRYGVDFVGLGAMLPGVTRYGKTIDVEGVETTTGHAGTVWLLSETVKKVSSAVQERDGATPESVSVLGAGSIGFAFAEYTLQNDENVSVNIYDTNEATLARVGHELKERFGDSRVRIVDSANELALHSRVLVSAVTSRETTQNYDSELLEGLTIVEDSEPGAFPWEEFEAKGARVVGVIGSAHPNPTHRFEREMGLNRYGGSLAGDRDGYGCELELWSLESTKRRDLRVASRVTMQDVQAISEQMVAAGITVSELQHAGKVL